MQKHLTGAAVLRIGLALLGLLLALLLFVLFRWILSFPEVQEEAMAAPMLTVMSNAAVVFLVLTSLLNIVAGWGLLNYQPWARYLTMLLAVFDLFNVPIGTALGAYTFWVLIQDETISLFESRGANRD